MTVRSRIGPRHQRRLTETEKLDIYRRFSAGESQESLARSYGCNNATIHYALKRQGYTPRPYTRMTTGQVAELMGLSGYGAIRAFAARHGIPWKVCINKRVTEKRHGKQGEAARAGDYDDDL